MEVSSRFIRLSVGGARLPSGLPHAAGESGAHFGGAD